MDMHIKLFVFSGLLAISTFTIAIADDSHKSSHGGQIFHAIRLETDIGVNRDGTVYNWDLDGWVGTDENKLWLKSEGEKEDGQTVESAEYWAMYSRNVATFWDAQVGIRFDEQPNSTTYLIAGAEGLAPYFFETEAHLFLSEDGDVTARIRQENDFLITQRLITQPYFEMNLSAQDVPEQEIGAGLTSGEIGIQTRYEVTRKFAPYVDLRYERKFGETSNIVKKNGENRDNAIASIGLRLMF
jgi:copper resistance protein B